MLLVLPVTKINQAEKSEVENRNLASWPEISRENLFQGQLAPALEKYFEDRFFGRDILLKISYAYNTFLKEHYENNSAWVGEDNWLFYKNEDSLRLCQNMVFFQEEEYPLIQQNLTSMHQWMTEQGIKFYMIYLPNKEDVYGEYMGHHIKKRTRPEADRFSLVVDYLQQHEAPLVPIYPLNRMLEEKKRSDALLYYKNDTHWSQYGAYIGYEALMQAIGRDFPDIEVLEPAKMDFSPRIKWEDGDLARMLTLDMRQELADTWYVAPQPRQGWQYYVIEEQFLQNGKVYYQNIIHPNGKYYIHTVNPRGRYKVIVFRDSFGINLLPYLAETFNDVRFYWTMDMDIAQYKDVMAQEKPDLVIFESVSRYAQYSLLNNKF